jgi:hypothetical protein
VPSVRKYSHKQVISKLGGMCAICKSRDYDVLQVDHPLGNGNLERRSRGQQQAIYRRIMEGSPGYRCLCASCNWKLRVREGRHGGRQAKEMTPESIERFKATLRKHLIWLLGEEDQ